MADAQTDDLILEIDDAALDGAADIIVEKTDDAGKQPVVEPDEGLDLLKSNLEKANQREADAQAARKEAERRAQHAEQIAANAQGQVQNAQLDQINGAIERFTQNAAYLKAQLREAIANGDPDAQADIQEQMGNNSAFLLRLNEGKSSLENAPPPQYQPPVDKVDAFVSRLSPQSAAWVRAHPEYARDDRLNAKMISAHGLVVADGIQIDTPEYFEAIENTLKITHHPVSDTVVIADEPAARRSSAPPAAPVSRGGGGNGSKPMTMRLTPAEVEAAADAGLSNEEYAKHKLALQKEGKIH